jgi:hypothetical protein
MHGAANHAGNMLACAKTVRLGHAPRQRMPSPWLGKTSEGAIFELNSEVLILW